MRNIKKAEVFSVMDLVPIKTNQTISKGITQAADYNIVLFGLDKGTHISAERYAEIKEYLLLQGHVTVGDKDLHERQMIFCPVGELFDIHVKEESILFEISLENTKETNMQNIKKGEVIELKEAIDYVDDAISNLDIASRDNIKMMLMAFDAGEGLTPHSAPGDALVIPLEGEAVVQIGDEKHEIKVGEQVVFPKDIDHSVQAKTKFKMLLVLVK